jgi:RNA polymerase sigma factor (sigma-70 family)
MSLENHEFGRKVSGSPSVSLDSVKSGSGARLYAKENQIAENKRDDKLVARFKAGDESALGEIMSLYKDRVFRYAFSIIYNEADAEIITQETFIKVYQHLMGFEQRAAFSTWLFLITYRLALDRLRHKKVDSERFVSVEAIEHPKMDLKKMPEDAFLSNAPSPSAQMDMKEFMHAIEGSM